MNHNQALDLLLAEPPPGSVVKLRVAYPDSPKTYAYALIEAGMRWYTTNNTEPRTWAEVVRWLETSVGAEIVSIEFATGWEALL